MLDLPYNPNLDHALGAVHGGVYATMLDIAGWFTAAGARDEPCWLVTSELSIRFLKCTIKKITWSGTRWARSSFFQTCLLNDLGMRTRHGKKSRTGKSYIDDQYLFRNPGKETRFLPLRLQKNLVSHPPNPSLLKRYDDHKARKEVEQLNGKELIKRYRDGERDFSGVDLEEANLGVATLREANLREANLSRTNLIGANLTGADLSGSDLFQALLFQVKLGKANLSNADLTEADLSGADLNRANLSGANLSQAILFQADLSGANLRDAQVSPEQLDDAKSLAGATMPDGTKHD